MTKTCIWCRKEESVANFNRQAHIFPKSLGGKRVCQQVCDECNTYFGSKQAGLPSVEIALKEPLNISRLYLISQLNKKVKSPRFKSEYFEYNLSRQLIKPKYKYSLISGFQNMFTKQFKRGVFKIFLEERSESIGDALSPQFDFIREYARYGLGDYPVFYCQPNIPAIFISLEDINNPVIRFTDHSEEVMKQYGFYSYYFMTHLIAIPVIRTFELTLNNYAKFMLNGERPIYSKLIPLKYITDLDFIFSFASRPS
jgi:hypothetical protein